MFKLHYQVNNDPQIEEEYSTYELVSARIVELTESFTSSYTFELSLYDSNSFLIQKASKT